MTERHVSLCSGGTDSVAATHYALTNGLADEVVFLNTRTAPEDAHSAIDATIEWLESWTDAHGWPFSVSAAPQSFAEITAEHGAPGPRNHFLMYRRLKDRAIDAVRRATDGELHCWTGIRRWESDTRMRVAESDGERGDGRWFWHAPIVDWTDADVREYLSEHDLEPAPVVDAIGRSADCWCGCFGDRTELVDLEAAGFAAHADWLRNLPTPDDAPRERQHWAGYNWDKSDWAGEDRMQTTLCSHCGARKEGAADD